MTKSYWVYLPHSSSTRAPHGNGQTLGTKKKMVTFAYLSNVEVEPTDEEVGVLYLLRHCPGP
jgi:hypothetical protein